MGTKKFKFGNADGNNIKGGKNNTRTILTAAGVVTVGAAGAGVGYTAGHAHGYSEAEAKKEEEPIEKPIEDVEEKTEVKEEQPTTDSSAQPTNRETPSQEGETITEPKPTDPDQVNHPQPSKPDVQEPDEVNPDDVAQRILEEEGIDTDDIDSPTIISVDELATLYRADGSEMLVAAVHTPDGAQFLLADIDGDGYFTDVFDLAGNYVGEAEGNMMESDLWAMVSEPDSYLAVVVEELEGYDPTDDIISTASPSDENLLAQIQETDRGEDEDVLSEGYYESDDDMEQDDTYEE